MNVRKILSIGLFLVLFGCGSQSDYIAFLETQEAYGAPKILYTDILSGPNTGGENNNGIYLSIFGTGFGSTQSTSTVEINGVEVAAYNCWDCSDQQGRSDIQKITVQPGSSVSTGAVEVIVSATSSNLDHTFTVAAGDIFYVDNTAAGGGDGSFATPYTNYITTWGLAGFGAGDFIVVRGKGTNYTSGQLDSSKSGSTGNMLHLVAYPNETVNIVHSSNSDLFATSGGANHWAFIGFNMSISFGSFENNRPTNGKYHSR